MCSIAISYGSSLAADFQESAEVKRRILAEQISTLEAIARVLITALGAGRKVLICGNGGSAADSQHMAGELVSKFRRERRALPAVALTTDTSILTSIGNDFGYENVFSRQVEALGEEGDVLVAISTSGNSPNVLKAMRTAREMGITTVGLTGEDGGRMRRCADFCFRVPSQSTPRIQEAHITAAHALCELIEQEFCSNGQ
ncbi:MAG: D-sedoheptulose 7-phosphate isomerase [Pirellulales bacterium]|nr:D-sedoheptulose 7-phosphate isomerase [Pirellulales bacterium]